MRYTIIKTHNPKEKNHDKKTTYAIYLGAKPEYQTRDYALLYPHIPASEYPPGKTLGKAQNAKIKLAQNIETGEWVAVKIQTVLALCISTTTLINNIKNEYRAWKRLDLALSTLVEHTPATLNTSTLFKCIYRRFTFFMPWYSGVEVFSFYDSSRTRPQSEWLSIAIACTDAVKRFHRNNMVHGDIKGENIIMNLTTGQASLIDPAFAEEISVLQKDDSLKSRVGTLVNAAPEMFPQNHLVERSAQADIYSLGATLAELFAMDIPNQEIIDHIKWQYENGSFINLVDVIAQTSIAGINQFYQYSTHIQEFYCFKRLSLLLKQMMHQDPNQRPRIDEVLGELNALYDLSVKKQPINKTVFILNIDD